MHFRQLALSFKGMPVPPHLTQHPLVAPKQYLKLLPSGNTNLMVDEPLDVVRCTRVDFVGGLAACWSTAALSCPVRSLRRAALSCAIRSNTFFFCSTASALIYPQTMSPTVV